METSNSFNIETNEKKLFTFKAPSTPKIESPPESAEGKNDLEEKVNEAELPLDNALPPKIPHTLPYDEPKWSGIPNEPYFLEVLKGGIIINNIDLNKKPFLMFGRMENCDIILEHPSISRYHAVVQYKKSEDETSGFYIFDLGSTHGTFINKTKISKKVYTRLKVGYVIKFGGSSRMFILQGPQQDEEPESELTITEIKELAKHKLLEHTKMIEEEKESECINWGISEDAEEIVNENPFAIVNNSEELNVEDPKKTLRGWFEREGCELVYNVEEIGIGHFSCKIELPICDSNGESIIAEADVKGKKKEVVIACALEACRILDQQGLLRQSHHESRKRKKNWEETDFYASDEDTFLDRTGTIEKKRFKRKLATNKVEAETYETIVGKLSKINSEIFELEAKLAQDKKNSLSNTTTDNFDSLDEFMNSLNTKTNLDKATKSKLKHELIELKKQQEHYTKLANVAKPTSLPPLNPYQANPKKDLRAFIGKRKIPKPRFSKPFQHPIVQPHKKSDNIEFKEEVEEEEEDDDKHTKKKEGENLTNEPEKIDKLAPKSFKKKCSENHNSSQNELEDLPNKEPKTTSSESPNKLLEQCAPNDFSLSAKESFQEKPNAFTCNPASSKTKNKGHQKINKPSKNAEYDENDPDYSMWLPPDNQKGDGMTHLNAKYGY